MEVQLGTFGTELKGVTTEQGDQKICAIDLPVTEPRKAPEDAPARYQMPPAVQAGSFASWREVSALMAPHYATDQPIAASATLKEAVETIRRQNVDELDRAAAALILVQDEISYLMNGMDGGNYRPQKPLDTWQQRHGDCKAKTLLLLTILRELGIESEAALVRSQGGDALPNLLPLPLNFDHVIVRATIGGKDYWLDGTSAGASKATLEEVPRFFHALPLRPDGADLVALEERAQIVPDVAVDLVLDQRAGIGIPGLYAAEFTISGAAGSQYRLTKATVDEKTRKAAVQKLTQQYLGETPLLDYEIVYDPVARVARIKAAGIMVTPWRLEHGRYVLDPPAQVARNVGFDANRSRPDWRDIPLRLNGPIYHRSSTAILLPGSGEGFTLRGRAELAEVIGGVSVTSAAAVAHDRIVVQQSMQSLQTELPADEIGAAKRGLSALNRDLPRVHAPEDILEADEYLGSSRKELAPIRAAYDRLVAQNSDANDPMPHWYRMDFLTSVGDLEAALPDIDRVIAVQPDAAQYETRGWLLSRLHRYDEALASYKLAEEENPTGLTYSAQAELLGMAGRDDELQALVDDYYEVAKERHQADILAAEALGLQGRYDEGEEVLLTALTSRPGDPVILNAICWFGARWNRVDDVLLQRCDEAVAKSNYGVAALDSRGVALLRAGRRSDAIADFTAVLTKSPLTAATRYVLGITQVAEGHADGRHNIARALNADPLLAPLYQRWGFDAPR